MRRFLLAVLALVAVSLGLVAPAAAARPDGRPGWADDGAHVVATTQVAPRQVDLTIASPALHGRSKVRLLTPDGWRPGAHQQWPVFYLLHGCCGDYTSWTSFTDVASIRSLRHVLVVMPEAGTAGWYSNWWNYGKGGAPAWTTYHLGEVRQILERGYGAGTRRVVAGLSMGGYGAIAYAAEYPGLFRAAASYSGVVHPLYRPGGPANVLSITAGQGFDPYRPWGGPVRQRGIWEAHDPYYRASELRHTPVFLSSGNGEPGPLDPPGTGFSDFEALFDAQSHALAARLRSEQVPLTTDFYGAGTHSWPYWQRELHRSLPMLLTALG